MKSLILALGLFTAVMPLSATKLVFDITNTSQIPDNSAVPQNYGDRVTATSMVSGALTFGYGSEGGFTPNVIASYGPATVTSNDTVTPCPFNATDSCVYTWGSDFGGLTNVIAQSADEQNASAYGKLEVMLTADAGFLVTLSSFDLGGWLRTDRTVSSVRVVDGANNTLFSAAGLVAPGTGALTVNFGSPLSAQQLRILIDASNQLGNNGQNVGLDNIVFGQTSVPEPSTLALAAGAFAVLVARRRSA
jgi:hypothetical protein